MITQEDFAGRYAPLSSKGMLVHTGTSHAVAALSSEHKAPYIKYGIPSGYTLPDMRPKRIEDLGQGLGSMMPICLRACRFLVVPTKLREWSAVFHNAYEMPDMRLVGGVSRLIQSRVIYYYSYDHSYKAVRSGGTVGHMGGYAFWVFDTGEPYKPDRTITCIREDNRWRFEALGDPLPFEDTKRYELPRALDRFNKEVMVSYFAALGLHPFDVSFFEVTTASPAWLLDDNRKMTEHAPIPDEVIRREWYRELGLSKEAVMAPMPKSGEG